MIFQPFRPPSDGLMVKLNSWPLEKDRLMGRQLSFKQNEIISLLFVDKLVDFFSFKNFENLTSLLILQYGNVKLCFS
jgi:hypothetical protein